MDITQKKFIEGEVYKLTRTESHKYPSDYIFVIGIDSEDKHGVLLAVFWVKSKEEDFDFIEPGELYVKKSEFNKWKKIKII